MTLDAQMTAVRRMLLGASVTAAFVLLPAAGAYASRGPDDGAEPGSGLSVIETLLWFVVAPAALFVGIAVLAAAPGMARGPRYRPGVGWWAAPVWFNGPDDPDTAVRTAAATPGGGGASARW